MNIEKLDKILRKIAPIDGVNSDGTVWFKNNATNEQIDSANNTVVAFIANEPGDNCVIWNGTGFSEDINLCKEELYQKISDKQKSVEDAGFSHKGDTFDFNDKTLYIIGSRLALTRDLMIDGETLTPEQLTFYRSDKEPVTFLNGSKFIDFCRAYIDARNKIDQRRVVLKSLADAITSEEDEESVETEIETGWV